MKRTENAYGDEVFDLEEAIERYANHIAVDIKSNKKRKEVAKEYAAHIEDAVYHEMLAGISERDAFFKACERLGEPAKLQEMLACVHNRDPLPSYVKWIAIVFFIAAVATLYFLIENTAFRAWIILFVQLTILSISLWVAYLMHRALRAVKRRRETLAKLRRFAEQHNLGFTLYGSGYAGMFFPTSRTDVTIDTPDCRYILSLWGTFYARRHLHLTDIGLYMHSQFFGYANIYTRVHSFFAPGFYLALPKGLSYFSMTHTELSDIPKGTRLLPKINWASKEVKGKKNVHILLLSPVPFKTSLLLSGRETEAFDGDAFLDSFVYSTQGFLSYLNGERIETDGSFHRTPLGKNK